MFLFKQKKKKQTNKQQTNKQTYKKKKNMLCWQILKVSTIFFPGACPDWSNWSNMDAYRNISEAMKMAEDWLNIEQVGQTCCLP